MLLRQDSNLDLDSVRLFFESVAGLTYWPAERGLSRASMGPSYQFYPRASLCFRQGDNAAKTVFKHWGSSKRALRARIVKDLLTGSNQSAFACSAPKDDSFVLLSGTEATVILAPDRGRTWKVTRRHDTRGAQVLEREISAASLIPALAPPTYAIGSEPSHVGNISFVEMDYLANAGPIKSGEWSEVLRRIQPHLLEYYVSRGISYVRAEDYLQDLLLKLNSARAMRAKTPHRLELLLRRWEHCLQQLQTMHADEPVFEAFVHGDLEPPNVRRDKSKIRLIDWGNSARRNLFFDVAYQEMNRGATSLWQQIQWDLPQSLDKYFAGWFLSMQSEFERHLSVRFSPGALRVAIVGSYVEKLLLDFRRYEAIPKVLSHTIATRCSESGISNGE